VLRFNREAYVEALSAGLVDEDGVESAFEVVTDIQESIRTGEWVGDCFIYTNSTNRLNYLVGDQTYTIAHFDQPMYLLGYLPRDGKLYLADKDVGVISYSLSLTVVEYQTLILRDDVDGAQNLLPDIPTDQMNKIARFLEGQGHKELALEVATDPEHRFELALSLNNLPIALEIAKDADVEHKWKIVGDKALECWDVKLAAECFENAKDLGSLLLVYSSTGDVEGLKRLALQAAEAGANNVAFSCLWVARDVDGCVDLLQRTGRVSEAVLFCQTYKPSRLQALVEEWKGKLEKDGKSKVSKLLGVPGVDADLFPEWDEYLKIEEESRNEVEEVTVNGKSNDEVVGNGMEENGVGAASE
jgi:coatomer subunit beta'